MSRNAPKYHAPRRNATAAYAKQDAYRSARMAVARAPPRNRAPRTVYVKGAIYPRNLPELKYVDVALANYVCDTTGTVTALNLLAIGDDNTSRDGRQVTIKSVQVRGIVKQIDTACGPTLCRVMLVWDNAVNSGTIATIAQILSAASSCSFPLIDNSQRFTILWDHYVALGLSVDTASQASNTSIPEAINYYKKLNLTTQYSGTTAAIGSIQNGALYLVTIGDQAAGAGGNFQAVTRVRFTDD